MELKMKAPLNTAASIAKLCDSAQKDSGGM